MKVPMHVPFCAPAVVGGEVESMRQAVQRGHVSGNGVFTAMCEQYLEGALGVKRAFLTTSCTHALELTALLLDLAPGDEVIVPSFTFVSTINAFVLRGARPIFVDVRPDTLNLDERRVEASITPRTRAIVAVHYGGVGCDMEALEKIRERHGLALIEDNAHGLFGRYRRRALGTFGRFATLSFHETKNISCGEGGALLLNDARDIERAEMLREKGTNRARFFRGEVDKYTWVDLGSSYVMSDMLAAYLWVQLNARDRIQARRRDIWERYKTGLSAWAADNGIQLPHIPEVCEQAYHLFYLIFPSLADRQAFIAHLKRESIHAVFHYQPLHASPMGLRLGGQVGQCPVTECLGDCLVRLPFYFNLDEATQDRVIKRVRQFRLR